MLLKQPAFSSSTTLGSLQFFICSLYSYIQTLSNLKRPVLVFRVFLVDTAGGKRDIVFLLDSSEDSRNGLPAIRQFIRRMAEGLDFYAFMLRLLSVVATPECILIC